MTGRERKNVTNLLNVCAKFHEDRTFTFRDITTSVMDERMNQQTDQQTRPITIAPAVWRRL